MEPCLWRGSTGGLLLDEKLLHLLYGSHSRDGNRLVELRKDGVKCIHPGWPYEGLYVYAIDEIDRGTIICPVVGSMDVGPITGVPCPYPDEERYAPTYYSLSAEGLNCYIYTHVVPLDGGYWFMSEDNRGRIGTDYFYVDITRDTSTWAPNYARFVEFSLDKEEVNTECVYVAVNCCFVLIALKDIKVGSKIIVYGSITDPLGIVARASHYSITTWP